MTILALDTCEVFCSAALVLPDGVAFKRTLNIGRGHAEHLLPMVGDLLQEAGLMYEGLSQIAVTTGPGTFTGLRIGLSVARGLALALDVPCIGLMSLPVLAATLMGQEDGRAHVVIKGRGGQVFYQAYEGWSEDGLPLAVAEPANIDADIAAEYIADHKGPVGGTGCVLLKDHLPAAWCRDVEAVDPVLLAQMSTKVCAEAFPPEPTYLRPADAVKAKAIFQVQVNN